MVTINLDGRERTLRFTLWSARKFKEKYGLPIIETFFTPSGQTARRIADSVCLTHVIWAGLLPDKPKVTVETTETMLSTYLDGGGSVKTLYDKVAEAMKESGIFGDLFDKDDDEDKDEAKGKDDDEGKEGNAVRPETD